MNANTVGSIPFKGQILIMPYRHQRFMTDMSTFSKALNGFSKFVNEELPDDVRVEVNLFDDRYPYGVKAGIRGGSNDSFDKTAEEDADDNFEEPNSGTLIGRPASIKHTVVTISAKSEDGTIYNNFWSGTDFRNQSENIQKNLFELYA